MIAGAPGACGSLVIFNSSGEMGWKPSANTTGETECNAIPARRTKMGADRRRDGMADLRNSRLEKKRREVPVRRVTHRVASDTTLCGQLRSGRGPSHGRLAT